jgi:hypothetical protein
VTAGVVTVGLVTDGVVTAGVATTGVVMTGVVMTGVVTAGAVTAGVVTAGVVTVGVANVAVTAGVETETVVGSGGRPSANAAPASTPQHARASTQNRYEGWGRSAPGVLFTVGSPQLERRFRVQFVTVQNHP